MTLVVSAGLSTLWKNSAHGAGAASGFRLLKGRDSYFVENNLVYRRFLELMHDGSYRQINQDRAACAEADAGTWEQAADGTVRLHSTRHALRFRAVLDGPLSVVLDTPEKIEASERLADAIRRCLASTHDAVFDAHSVDGLSASPAFIVIDPHVETYSRADLLTLLRQIEENLSAERSGIYLFTPVKIEGTPSMLILRGAVFQAGDIARVRREYHVRPGAPPPFYFAQVDARTFVREVGKWESSHTPGGIE